MLRTKVLRVVRMAALAAAVSVAFGSLAWAHDDDDYYYRHDEAREHGYRNGYQDGVRHGRYDRAQGYRYNYKSQQWDDGDGGYQRWMGSHGQYKKAYRAGYIEGYQRGFGAYGYRDYGYRDDHYRHDRDDW